MNPLVSPAATPRLELWAGAEGTLARIHDRYVDETVLTGHDVRPDDMDRLAELGVSAVRLPVLWERTAPDAIDGADWTFSDARLERLRASGIRPIVGLVHHGSGPRDTSLLEESFVEGLARFARAVAARYPWVTDFTPVNEPLTTARFSALYGHWYPHCTDATSFVRAVVVQCRGIIEAMRAIRTITPHARLIQTDDMGRTSSPPGASPALLAQCDFDNARRWLAFDLLFARVDARHPLWRWLRDHGFSERDEHYFAAADVRPHVVGLNYYLTSDRFLDENLTLYPTENRGGNGRIAYADIESVRVHGQHVYGHDAVLREAWQRYRLPVAVTECHLGCTREEQLRWLVEAWQAARRVRDEGVDVRAVTLWSAFGVIDWSSLLVQALGHYESGAWDIRARIPRPTALVSLARGLADGLEPTHPVLATPGWWRRPERARYPCTTIALPHQGPPILIVGGRGTLGDALARACHERGLAHCAAAHVDACSAARVEHVLDELKSWAVVNASGYVRVDDAEDDEQSCRRINIHGALVLAAACQRRGIRYLTFSSDLVFAGRQTRPYLEDSHAVPLNVYGHSKLEAERGVLRTCPEALVVRTSAFFGPWDRGNFLTTVLATLRRGDVLRAAADQIVSPTYVPDLAHAALDLLIDGASGVWHLANVGEVSWAALAARVAAHAQLDADLVRPVSSSSLGLRATRPAYSALGSARASLMGPLEDALARYVRDVRPWVEHQQHRADGR